MPEKNEGSDDYPELRVLLEDRGLWAAAAEVLRETRKRKRLSQKEIEGLLGVSQPTVSRILAGELTGDALLKYLPGLTRLLERLELTAETLSELAHKPGLLLCIDHPDEEERSIQCPTIHFHAAGDHAVPFPMDPRSDQSEKICRWCGNPLSAKCPECQKRVLAASHCPQCGHRYVAGAPEELRGLTGKRLVQACEKRNAANRAAMQHAEKGLET